MKINNLAAGGPILITRPEGQRDRLAAVLAEAGYASRLLPMLALRAVSEPAQVASVKTRLGAISSRDLAIFISSNAVNYASRIAEHWPASVPCVPIGQATAKALALQGWPVIQDSAEALAPQTSERLLATPALKNVAGKKITIFRGVGGREVLAEALRQRGASVDYCELYIRDYPQYDYASFAAALGIDQAVPPAAIIFASCETLENFYQHVQRHQLTTQLMATPVLVPSERVKVQAQALGVKTVWVAANASAEGFLQALNQHLGAIDG